MADQTAPASPGADANDATGQAAGQGPEGDQSASDIDDVKQKFRAALHRKAEARNARQASAAEAATRSPAFTAPRAVGAPSAARAADRIRAASAAG